MRVPLLLLAVAAACGTSDPRSQLDRSRDYKAGKYERAPQSVSEGSLWQDSNRGLFADFRASRVGDLVTIVIDESARASGEASTDAKRDYSEGFGVPKLFGLTASLQKLYPDIDPNELLRVVADSRFSATGDTERGSRMRATIGTRVKQQLPNGDLFVEGTKTAQINDEQLQIYISGVIRPEDIQQDNSVGSSRIADAEIQFIGKGELSENRKKGWLARLIAKIRPF